MFRLTISDMNKTMKKTKVGTAHIQEYTATTGKRNSIIALHDKERDIVNKLAGKPGAKVHLCYMRGKKDNTTNI